MLSLSRLPARLPRHPRRETLLLCASRAIVPSVACSRLPVLPSAGARWATVTSHQQALSPTEGLVVAARDAAVGLLHAVDRFVSRRTSRLLKIVVKALTQLSTDISLTPQELLLASIILYRLQTGSSTTPPPELLAIEAAWSKKPGTLRVADEQLYLPAYSEPVTDLYTIAAIRRYLVYSLAAYYSEPGEVQRELGLREHDIIAYNLERTDAESVVPAFFVAVDHAARALVVSVRGTYSITEVLVNFTVAPEEFQGGMVHRGMLLAASGLVAHLRNRLDLDAFFLERPEYTLVVTGHSMGAAVAALVAMMLKVRYSHTRAYAFCPPSCVSSELAASSAPYVLSLVNGDDAVVRFHYDAVVNLKEAMKDLDVQQTVLRSLSLDRVLTPQVVATILAAGVRVGSVLSGAAHWTGIGVKLLFLPLTEWRESWEATYRALPAPPRLSLPSIPLPSIPLPDIKAALPEIKAALPAVKLPHVELPAGSLDKLDTARQAIAEGVNAALSKAAPAAGTIIKALPAKLASGALQLDTTSDNLRHRPGSRYGLGSAIDAGASIAEYDRAVADADSAATAAAEQARQNPPRRNPPPAGSYVPDVDVAEGEIEDPDAGQVCVIFRVDHVASNHQLLDDASGDSGAAHRGASGRDGATGCGNAATHGADTPAHGSEAGQLAVRRHRGRQPHGFGLQHVNDKQQRHGASSSRDASNGDVELAVEPGSIVESPADPYGGETETVRQAAAREWTTEESGPTFTTLAGQLFGAGPAEPEQRPEPVTLATARDEADAMSRAGGADDCRAGKAGERHITTGSGQGSSGEVSDSGPPELVFAAADDGPDSEREAEPATQASVAPETASAAVADPGSAGGGVASSDAVLSTPPADTSVGAAETAVPPQRANGTLVASSSGGSAVTTATASQPPAKNTDRLQYYPPGALLYLAYPEAYTRMVIRQQQQEQRKQERDPAAAAASHETSSSAAAQKHSVEPMAEEVGLLASAGDSGMMGSYLGRTLATRLAAARSYGHYLSHREKGDDDYDEEEEEDAELEPDAYRRRVLRPAISSRRAWWRIARDDLGTYHRPGDANLAAAVIASAAAASAAAGGVVQGGLDAGGAAAASVAEAGDAAAAQEIQPGQPRPPPEGGPTAPAAGTAAADRLYHPPALGAYCGPVLLRLRGVNEGPATVPPGSVFYPRDPPPAEGMGQPPLAGPLLRDPYQDDDDDEAGDGYSVIGDPEEQREQARLQRGASPQLQPAQASSPQDASGPPPPAPEAPSAAASAERAATVVASLLPRDASRYFGHLVLSRTMFTDHLLGSLTLELDAWTRQLLEGRAHEALRRGNVALATSLSQLLQKAAPLYQGAGAYRPPSARLFHVASGQHISGGRRRAGLAAWHSDHPDIDAPQRHPGRDAAPSSDEDADDDGHNTDITRGASGVPRAGVRHGAIGFDAAVISSVTKRAGGSLGDNRESK